MNILYLGYWGANEGLTTATILPNLSILSEFEHVEKIIYCSIERDNDIAFNISIDKVKHIPLYSIKSKIPLLDKITDFINFPRTLTSLCKKHKIDKIISRGAPAGGLAFLTYKKTSIPFIVESFEPHADYMLESNVWSKYDPRYISEVYWETKAKQKAEHLVTVSGNFKNLLIKQGVSSNRISTVPCCVNLDHFKYNASKRQELREQNGIDEDTLVGIYVGKFGDIYLDHEAFSVFAETLSSFPKSALVLLTPEKEDFIKERLNNHPELTNIQVITLLAPHNEVPNYLSLADIAFATIRPAPSRQYCSAIKIGEYYASGLPIVITEGCGDDSDLIKKHQLGTVVDHNFNVATQELKACIAANKEREHNALTEMAKTHRSFEIQKQVYSTLILK